MTGVLIDSSVILDVFENDPVWAEWSENMLHEYSLSCKLYINPVVYSEVSIGFERIEEFESALHGCGFELLSLPKEALFLAGKAFLFYKQRIGNKTSPL